MSTSESLTAAQTLLNGLWETHTTSEFAHKSADEAIATMTDNPQVIHVPTLIGGRGREQLYTFYAKHFLNQLPPDLEIVPLSRTIGNNRVVDELVTRFTHSTYLDWVLPGIPPTHKRIEFALVVIVEFENGKISSERIYYDNATVLRQIGLLPDPELPVLGAESAQGLLAPTPLNQLLDRTVR